MSEPGTSSRFAELIKNKRQATGLSHEALAVAAGIDRSTVSLIESGKRTPSLTTAERLATALGEKLSDLIAEAD